MWSKEVVVADERQLLPEYDSAVYLKENGQGSSKGGHSGSKD